MNTGLWRNQHIVDSAHPWTGRSDMAAAIDPSLRRRAACWRKLQKHCADRLSKSGCHKAPWTLACTKWPVRRSSHSDLFGQPCASQGRKKTCLWPCASIPPCSPFLSVTLTMIKFHKVFYSDKLVFLQGMMLTKQGEQGGRQVFETVCGCSFRVWVCFETHLQNCRPLSGKPRCTHPWSQRWSASPCWDRSIAERPQTVAQTSQARHALQDFRAKKISPSWLDPPLWCFPLYLLVFLATCPFELQVALQAAWKASAVCERAQAFGIYMVSSRLWVLVVWVQKILGIEAIDPCSSTAIGRSFLRPSIHLYLYLGIYIYIIIDIR